jgi:hypothetical protein
VLVDQQEYVVTEPRPARKPAKSTPTSVRRPVASKARPKDASPAWYAPTFVTLMLLGLLWIVDLLPEPGPLPGGLPRQLEPRRGRRPAHRRLPDDHELALTSEARYPHLLTRL